MSTSIDKNDLGAFEERLNKLEERLIKIEKRLEASGEIADYTAEPDEQTTVQETDDEREERFESTIGQSWMALIGIIVIVAGLSISLSLSFESLPAILPSAVGFLLTGVLFGLSIFLRNNYSDISKYLVGGAMFLFYFSTLRLYYFGKESAIEMPGTLIILLTLVVIINTLISLRKKSIYLFCISLTLGLGTTLLSNNILYLYLALTVISALSTFFKTKMEWAGIANYFMPLTFLTHIVWLLINKSILVETELLSSSLINSIFALIYSLIYFFSNLIKKENEKETIANGVYSFFNSGFVVLIIFVITTILKLESTAWHYFIASIVFMLFAVALWIKEKSKFSTFSYAMIGYFALSLAIISLNIPNYLIWLCWQSLLVIATAVWFRSKFIVVANFFIYALVLLTYYITIDSVSVFALSFGIVALVSARILNWNKSRLELTTDQMRVVYLASAFFALPYTLYFTVPQNFISLSWIALAVIYYVLSLVLKNNKYRWMTIYTFLLTIVYVTIMAFTSQNTTYKIVSFLGLGAALITISIFYTRKMRKK